MRKVSADDVSGSTPGNVSSEVSLHFGPAWPESSSSPRAAPLHRCASAMRFNMIRFGLAEHLVTGGTDATITPGIMQGFCVMRVVSCSRNTNLTGLRARSIAQPRRVRARRGRLDLGPRGEPQRSGPTRSTHLCGEFLGLAPPVMRITGSGSTRMGGRAAGAMSLAIQDAAIAKDEIGYVALHGTSTILDDRTERLPPSFVLAARLRDPHQLGEIHDWPPAGSFRRSRRGCRDYGDEPQFFPRPSTVTSRIRSATLTIFQIGALPGLSTFHCAIASASAPRTRPW